MESTTSQLPHYQISQWQGEHFRPVNQFYRRQKHKGSASGNETVFVIEDNENMIGAVRLVPYEGYFWLRSLYIEQTIQGKGLGSQLLQHINKAISLPIYCFPYTHLEHFYRLSGYELLIDEQLPLSMQQLFARYNRKGQSILAMAKLI